MPVVSQLLSDGQRDAFLEGVAKDYDTIRTRHAAKTGERPLASYEAAVANRLQLDWAAHRPMRPHLLTQQTRDRWSGPTDSHWHRAATQFTRVWEDFLVGELRRYIDWTPFFLAWEIKGRYPDVLNNPATSEQAHAPRRREPHARPHRARALGQRPRAVGIFPANGVGDDVEVYADEARSSVLTTLHGLRQQGQHRDGVANKCLSDFVAPRETGVADHVGAFSVTAGLGSRSTSRGSRTTSTTTRRSCSRPSPTGSRRRSRSASTRRSARAGATPPTSTSMLDLIQEKYAGIRPPRAIRRARPHREGDHGAFGGEERTGIRLTESMAMWPGALGVGLVPRPP